MALLSSPRLAATTQSQQPAPLLVQYGQFWSHLQVGGGCGFSSPFSKPEPDQSRLLCTVGVKSVGLNLIRPKAITGIL